MVAAGNALSMGQPGAWSKVFILRIQKESNNLKRPDEPLKSFQMDFTQKKIEIRSDGGTELYPL